MMLNEAIKDERSEAEDIVEQLLKANGKDPVAALYDAGLWILEVHAQRLQAEGAVSAGYVRRGPSGE